MPQKAPPYRLQVLLTIRERNKRNAEIELSRAVKQLKEEEERLQTLKDEKEELKEKKHNSIREMSRKLSGGESLVKESGVHLNFLKKIDEDIEEKEKEIEEQEETVKLAEEELKQARVDYIDACQAMKVMEKHKELWLKKQKKKLNAAEEKELGELGNVIHQMKKG